MKLRIFSNEQVKPSVGAERAKSSTSDSEEAGFSLIEVLVASVIFLIIFLGIAQAFATALNFVTRTGAKAGAVSLATEQIEFVKNLSYDNVGTQGGIPAGVIPQTESIVRNNIDYTRETLIQFSDNPSDGVGASDANGITADYKKVKVTVNWDFKGSHKSTFFVTNVAPRGIESLAGGGTLRVQVFDASATPVPGAKVMIKNPSLSPPVDVTVTTNSTGEVIFPGSPDGSSYEVTVTKSGYSIAKTYDASSTNVSPSPGHLTVVEGNVTTASFQIDKLGSMKVHTYEAYADTAWENTFDDASQIASSSQVEVTSGMAVLKKVAGSFASSGSFLTVDISPDYLDHWSALAVTESVPAGTNVRYRLYYENAGVFSLIPDSDLSGNSSGFTILPVDLSSLSVDTYRSLRVETTLETTVSSSTPSVDTLTLSYHGGPVSVGSIPLSLRGEKTIGTDGGGDSIYKFNTNITMNSSGEYIVSNLEWDNYHFQIDSGTGYDIAGMCPPGPVSLLPGASLETDIILGPDTPNSLLVSVFDSSGNPLPEASVTLSASSTGYHDEQEATSCGQSFFAGLAGGEFIEYSASVAAPSYVSNMVGNIKVTGPKLIEVTLSS